MDMEWVAVRAYMPPPYCDGSGVDGRTIARAGKSTAGRVHGDRMLGVDADAEGKGSDPLMFCCRILRVC